MINPDAIETIRKRLAEVELEYAGITPGVNDDSVLEGERDTLVWVLSVLQPGPESPVPTPQSLGITPDHDGWFTEYTAAVKATYGPEALDEAVRRAYPRGAGFYDPIDPSAA